MGLFQHKQQPQKNAPIDETSDGIQKFFDGYFQELRERGQEYFDRVVDDSSAQFKQELDAAVAHASTELKEHIAAQLDKQAADNSQAMKDAQDVLLDSLRNSSEVFEQQYQQLGASLQKVVAHQQATLAKVFEETNAEIIAMKDAQNAALQSLNGSIQALQQQQQQIGETLQKNVTQQEAVLVAAFEQNMAQVIEHYLLGALGDQYDLKAQLPSIIKQMEANKEAIVDDMKL